MTHEISAGLGKGDGEQGELEKGRPWRGEREREREGERRVGGGKRELRHCIYMYM